MAELAVTDGMPPPADLPRGEVIVTRLPDGSLRIDHADPRVLISAELLAEIFTAPWPGVSIGTDLVREDRNGTPFWEGALLRIHGVNRTVIYRVLEYVPRVHAYIGEWPD